jgi:leucyl-tRNA synthetase
VVNGVSERGGHPVVKKKMRQWYLRITEYADRLLQGLEQVDFSDSMKEMQRNWIGKSQGAEITFRLNPGPSPRGEGSRETSEKMSGHFFKSGNQKFWKTLKQYGRDNRKSPTEAEDLLWQNLRNNKLDIKVRRQHALNGFIADFALMEIKLVIEIDGSYHNKEQQQEYDEARTKYLHEFGFDILRFSNEEVLHHTQTVVSRIKQEIKTRQQIKETSAVPPLFREENGSGDEATLRVYTTRPDTIFGVDFMVIAPEHQLVHKITSPGQKPEIDKYLEYVQSRSERERLAEVKSITGAFTGAYAINPFDGREIPIWISEYVLAGYGTGAIMAVPCGDQRDFAFAKHFNIPITNIIGEAFNDEEANPTKDAVLQHSGFLDGMVMRDAINVVIDELEEVGIGKRQVNYRMRDAGFSRQRYWGEPFPIVYKGGVAFALDEGQLPVELPYVDTYSAGPEGEGPLANLSDWIIAPGGGTRETNTMPGYAGSSWYFLRYMDPHNDHAFVDRKATDYWNQVDLYIGGTEHAVGHLLYSRLWTKVLFDLGYIGFDEPYKKLVNQGMIQGSSRFVYRFKIDFREEYKSINSILSSCQIFISKDLIPMVKPSFYDEEYNLLKILPELIPELINADLTIEKFEGAEVSIFDLHTEVNFVDGVELKTDSFKKWKPEYNNAVFILNNDHKYICGAEVEKMSKSKYNVVNPDEIVERFGADTFRMYEMFLGPVEQSKPWDTKGIEGVHRFLRKFWRLYVNEIKGLIITNDTATPAELKVLHRTIKKIEEDTERFSFNTAVSAFMVCVNELNDLKCHKKEVLQPLLILLTSYAPHIAEELWKLMENEGSVLDAAFPKFEEKYLVESSKEYPVSINGKHRTNIKISLDTQQSEVEQIVMANEVVQKWLEGKAPKKIIFVKGKMINVVI